MTNIILYIFVPITFAKYPVQIGPSLSHPRRTKRGLINGLGSAISRLTRNMDANDKVRYGEILRKVEANELFADSEHCNQQVALAETQELEGRAGK